MELDIYDKKILTLLQKDNKISQRDIADMVNLSASAVNRRIAQLEASGIITQNVSIVDPAKVGRPICIIVEVKIANERLDLLEENRRKFVSCPQIQQVYYVTGNFDFLLVINVRDIDEYEQLSKDMFFTDENIKSFKTIVVMQKAKQNFNVLIE